MIPPIDNFISRAPDTFLAGPYLDMVMNMYKKAVGDVTSDESEAATATELVESIMHNCKGRVDRIIPDILGITVQRLNSITDPKESQSFRVLLIEVISNALYYNPALALSIMESQKMTQSVFGQWLALIPHFKNQYDIKLIVLGLSAIFELPPSSLPPIVQQGAKVILEALVQLLQRSEKLKKKADERKLDREHQLAILKKEEEDNKANGKHIGNGIEDDEEEEEAAMNDTPDNEDAQADDSDDDDEFSMLTSSVRSIIADDQAIDLGDDSSDEAAVDGEDFEEDDEEDEDDDEDDDDDDDDDDDEEYITIIDQVDELVYFASRVHNLYTNDASFQAVLSSLAPENQKNLKDI